MKEITEHLDNILKETKALQQKKCMTEPDEFVAVSDIERAVQKARKVFERKDVFDNGKLGHTDNCFECR